MAETIAFKCRAFLSYSHRDIAWGKWLHAALEGTRIGKDLVGRETPAGPVPKTLRPIFRDREDFSAGHSLTEQTLAALEASQFLIVLCSPNAAKSEYVNEEIRRFKALGRADRVIPVIVDGEPGDAERECFPPALRFKLGADGTLTDEREEPIAADARPQGDGKEIAKQKVVAGLLGLGLDEIVRRAERARKRRHRFWAALAGVFLLLAVAATGSAVYAWQQLKTNEAFLNATLRTATEIVNTAVAQAEKYNVPRGATLELLAKAEVLFDDMARLGRPTPELRYRKALMLIHFARNYAILGDSRRQHARAVDALHLLAGLAEAKPDDPAYQHDLSLTYLEIGDVLVKQGNLSEALNAYRDSFVIRERLAKADPAASIWQRELSVSYNRIGDVLLEQGNLPEALEAYRAGFAIRESLTEADPANASWLRDLSVSYNKIGNVLVRQGDLTEALKAYQDCLAIAERLTRADPTDILWQLDLGIGHERVGDILMAQGDFAAALKEYKIKREIARRFAKADPTNTNWQRDLFVACGKVGDALRAQENLADALTAYRDGLAIAELLAKVDTTNTLWENDLRLVVSRLGGLSYGFVLARDFNNALDAAERAIAASPDQIWIYGNRAHALMFLGRVDEARALYLQYRGKEKVQEDKSWDTVIGEDFADLRKAGLMHPLMDEIDAKFAARG